MPTEVPNSTSVIKTYGDDPVATSLPDGNYVVAFVDETSSSNRLQGSYEIFDNSGESSGASRAVNPAVHAPTVRFPTAITSLANGGFAVTSEDPSSRNFYLQTFDAQGGPTGSEYAIPASRTGWEQSLTTLSDGSLLVAWDFQAGTSGDNPFIDFQRFSATGASLGSIAQPSPGATPSVAGLTGGGFVLVSATTHSDGPLFLKSFDNSGNSTSAPLQFGTGSEPVVTALSGGGYAVAWLSTALNGPVMTQVYAADGSLVGGPLQVNQEQSGGIYPGDPPFLSITALQDGGFAVASQGLNFSNKNDILLDQFDSQGRRVGSEVVVKADPTTSDFSPTLTTLANGDIVVAWNANPVREGVYQPQLLDRIYVPSPSTLGHNYELFPTSGQTIDRFLLNNDQLGVTIGTGGFNPAGYTTGQASFNLIEVANPTTNIAGAQILRWTGAATSADSAAKVDGLLQSMPGSGAGGVFVIGYAADDTHVALYYDSDPAHPGGAAQIASFGNLTNVENLMSDEFVTQPGSILTGTSGNDSFALSPSVPDTITGFDAQGTDVLSIPTGSGGFSLRGLGSGQTSPVIADASASWNNISGAQVIRWDGDHTAVDNAAGVGGLLAAMPGNQGGGVFVIGYQADDAHLALYYDADPTSGAAATLVATFTDLTDPSGLKAEDFLLGASGGTGTGGGAGGNLIVNGDFNPPGPGTWPAGALTGWTLGGAASTQPVTLGDLGNGVTSLELQPNEAASQLVHTQIGSEYILQWGEYRYDVTQLGPHPPNPVPQVLWDGTVVQGTPLTPVSPNGGWVTEQAVVQGTGSDTLTLQSFAPLSTLSESFDNVSLVAAGNGGGGGSGGLTGTAGNDSFALSASSVDTVTGFDAQGTDVLTVATGSGGFALRSLASGQTNPVVVDASASWNNISGAQVLRWDGDHTAVDSTAKVGGLLAAMPGNGGSGGIFVIGYQGDDTHLALYYAANPSSGAPATLVADFTDLTTPTALQAEDFALNGASGGGTAPTISLGNSTNALTHTEGDAGATAFTFTVTRTGDLSAATSANWIVSGVASSRATSQFGSGPATPDDFVGGAFPSGSVTFAAGQSSQTITVNVAGDKTVEPDQNFDVTLTNPVNATISGATAHAVILNDDIPANSILVNGDFSESGPTTGQIPGWQSSNIPNGGPAPISTVNNLSGVHAVQVPQTAVVDLPSGIFSGDISQNIATTSGANYTLQWEQQVASISQLAPHPFGDVLWDGQVVSGVTLSPFSPDNGGFITMQATVTGTGSDTLTLRSTGQGETGQGEEFAYVSLVPTGSGGGATGGITGTAGNDSFALSASSVDTITGFDAQGTDVLTVATSSGGFALRSLASGQTNPVVVDASASWNNITGAQVLRWDGDHTAVDSAAKVGGLLAAMPGNGGSGGIFVIGYQGDDTHLALYYAANPSSGAPATLVANFTDLTNPNALQAEDFALNGSGGGGGGSATLSWGLLQHGSVQLAEGDAGSTPFAFTLTRSGDLSAASSVNWAVTGAATDTSDANQYGAAPASAANFAGGVLPSGTATFAPGQGSLTITVQVAGDTTPAPSENFTVTLSNPVGATIDGSASAHAVILNDDVPANSLIVNGTSSQPGAGTWGPGGVPGWTLTSTSSPQSVVLVPVGYNYGQPVQTSDAALSLSPNSPTDAGESVYQTIQTQPGTTYVLQWDEYNYGAAMHPVPAPQILWDGTAVTPTQISTGTPYGSWITKQATVQGTGSDTLTLAAHTSTSLGISAEFDNVSLLAAGGGGGGGGLTGTAGNDSFALSPSHAVTITGFDAQGTDVLAVPTDSGGFALRDLASGQTSPVIVDASASWNNISGAQVVRWDGDHAAVDSAAKVGGLLAAMPGDQGAGVFVIGYQADDAHLALYYSANPSSGAPATLVANFTDLTSPSALQAEDFALGGSGGGDTGGGGGTDTLAGSTETGTSGNDVFMLSATSATTLTGFGAAGHDLVGVPVGAGGFQLNGNPTTSLTMVDASASWNNISGAQAIRWLGDASAADSAAKVDGLLQAMPGNQGGGVLVIGYAADDSHAAIYYDADPAHPGGASLVATFTDVTGVAGLSASSFELFGGGGTGSGNLIQNGDFEQPGVGSWPNGAVPDWTLSFPGDRTANLTIKQDPNVTTGNVAVIPTEPGPQGGYSADLTQTVDAQTGQSYVLHFTSYTDGSALANAVYPPKVLWDGQQVQLTDTGTHTGPTFWSTYEATVVGQAGSDTLTFEAGSAGGTSNYLADVSLDAFV